MHFTFIRRLLIALRALGPLVALTGAFAVTASAQERYKIISLPTPDGYDSAALGLNDNGSIVGYSFQGDNYQSFLYSQSTGSSADVGSLGGQMNAACAINDSGQVAGYSQDGNGNLLAFIYTKEDGIKALGALDGGVSSEAFGLNNSGQAVGDSQNATDDHHPVLFDSGVVKDLNVSVAQNSDAFRTAYAINDSGQIAGRTDTDQGAVHAFLLASPGGDLKDIGTLGGTNSEALAINKSGEVVGDGETASGTPHAFLYRKGSTRDLGTLSGFDAASYGRSINNQGQVVGDSDSADQKRAFVYSNGQMLELDKLATDLDQAGFKSLDVAYGINNHGWIVGFGTGSDGRSIAFLAIPEGQGAVQQTQVQPPPAQPQGQAGEGNGDDYSVFYSRLSSDGDWVEAGDYGYVFHPRATEGDWAPYRDGHWVWTDRGWFWYSNEHFGWATYHYGRWVRIGGQGWCWVPGNEWAPAWVSWRQSSQYVGWAPLPPEASVNVSVGIAGWADTYYGLGPAAYSFISFKSWGQPSYLRVLAPPAENVQIIRQTTNITNVRIQNTVISNFGPRIEEVGQWTNQKIVPTKIVFNGNRQAEYGTTIKGTELQVVAPAEKLRPVSTVQPAVKTRLAKAEVENGWNGVNPAEQSELRKKFAEQNPLPQQQLPKPSFAKPTFVRETKNVNPPPAGGARRPANTPPVAGAQHPGTASPVAGTRSENGGGRGWNTMPPNLIGSRRTGGETFNKTLPERRGANSAVTPKNQEQRLRKQEPAATPSVPGQVERKETPNPAPGGGQKPGNLEKNKAEGAPKEGTTPKQENGPKVETTSTPRAEPEKKTEGPLKAEGTPKAEPEKKAEGAPKAEETPTAGTSPKGQPMKNPEGTPKAAEPEKKPENTPKVENPPKPEEAQKGGALRKEERAPNRENPPKVEQAPKVEQGPKGEPAKKEQSAPKPENAPKEERQPKPEPGKKEEGAPKQENAAKQENAPKEERPKGEPAKKEEVGPKQENRENRGPSGQGEKPEPQEKEKEKGKPKGSPTA